MGRVAVVLVNWNGWRDTLACVLSVLANSSDDDHIIVCDNASSDDSIAHLKNELAQRGVAHVVSAAGQPLPALTRACRVLLAETGRNLGFAGGCNVGLRHALLQGYEYAWLLNNDTEIDEQTLPALLARTASDPTIGICGSTLIYHDQRDKVQALGGATHDPETGSGRHIGVGTSPARLPEVGEVEARMNYVVGASMFVRRRFLQQVGLLAEDYFLYYEEADWAERARGQFRLAWAADSRVYHKEGASIGSSHRHRPSDLSLRFLYRNRLKFTRRFYPHHLNAVRRRILREAVSYLRRLDQKALRIIAGALWQDWKAGAA